MQELNQTLNTIKSKQKLGLPLTDRERALWTLYGDDIKAICAAADEAQAFGFRVCPRNRGGLAVIKKIKELTAAEIDHYCDDRRDQNQTNKPYNACVACPLRWARQCSACVPIMPQHLVTRMYKAIGDRNINITSEVKINEN